LRPDDDDGSEDSRSLGQELEIRFQTSGKTNIIGDQEWI
jgi:hypothetical protein